MSRAREGDDMDDDDAGSDTGSTCWLVVSPRTGYAMGPVMRLTEPRCSVSLRCASMLMREAGLLSGVDETAFLLPKPEKNGRLDFTAGEDGTTVVNGVEADVAEGATVIHNTPKKTVRRNR